MTFKDFMLFVIFIAACVFLLEKAKSYHRVSTPATTDVIVDDDDEGEGDSLDRTRRHNRNRSI